MVRDVCFISSSQVYICLHNTSRVMLFVYLSVSSMLVCLSSVYGLNTGLNMKGLLLLVGTLIITQCAVLYIYPWRFDWRMLRSTEAWGFWTTHFLRKRFTVVHNTLHGVRKFKFDSIFAWENFYSIPPLIKKTKKSDIRLFLCQVNKGQEGHNTPKYVMLMFSKFINNFKILCKSRLHYCTRRNGPIGNIVRQIDMI